uniref:3-hydroxyacyl-CoA dehydrogenase NAD binding domain-containing protein n=1 Tax=Sus scrofa TaxID=9823 RepID=A0A8D1UEK4_PIG
MGAVASAPRGAWTWCWREDPGAPTWHHCKQTQLPKHVLSGYGCLSPCSGLIGRSWAMLFASGGFRVKLYDIEQQQVTGALDTIRKEMKLLEQSGALKGSLGAEEQLALISGCSDLREAVEGTVHIQRMFTEQTRKSAPSSHLPDVRPCVK